jgi:hypothetical protein
LGCCGAGRRSLQRCYCSLRWAITIAEGGAGVVGILAGEGSCGKG